MKKILHDLQSTDEAERIYAAQDIGERRNPDMAAQLIRRLTVETSQLVKDAIVFNLKKMPCHRIYEELFRLFASSDAFLRNAAVAVFGSEKDAAIAFLTAHLDHANREVRKLILDALFLTGTPEARLAIRAGLHDPSINVQITAVEYLGTMEDRGSIDDMLLLLEKKTEPMLRCTILDSLARISTDGIIQKVMAVLGAEEDINRIEAVFIPGVIRLAAQSGDLDFICKVFETIKDLHTYADDIMRAVGETRRHFKNILDECCVLDMVVSMAKNPRLREDVRYGAVELILSDDQKLLKGGELLSLGNALISEPSMIYAGVRLLALSEEKSGMDTIREIITETKDEELRSLCEELSGDSPKPSLCAENGGQKRGIYHP